MKFTIANALTIIDKHKAESAKKMGMTVNNLCNSCTTVETIPQSEYEARLKADMVAMLEELKTEIEEMQSREDWCDYATDNCIDRCGVDAIIRLKIHALKENTDG